MVSSRPHRVAVLVLPGVIPLELGIVTEVFGRDPHYDVTVCAQRRTSPVSGSGFTINASAGIQALDQAETVIVPGYEDVDATVSTIALDALRAAHARRARLVSICTGAFALAATGLLDGRPATTHWRWSHELQTRYPRVNVLSNRLFVDDDDILTSAGVTTGIDLCLHIIRRDHGAAAANNRARALVAPPQRQGGQAQFVERLRPESSDDQLAALRDWMLKNLALPLDLDTLATHAHVSRRTLTRRFREETGLPPMAWLTDAAHRPRPRVVGDDHRTCREHRPPHRTWRSRLCPRRVSQASRHLAAGLSVPVPPPHADLDPGRVGRSRVTSRADVRQRRHPRGPLLPPLRGQMPCDRGPFATTRVGSGEAASGISSHGGRDASRVISGAPSWTTRSRLARWASSLVPPIASVTG